MRKDKLLKHLNNKFNKQGLIFEEPIGEDIRKNQDGIIMRDIDNPSVKVFLNMDISEQFEKIAEETLKSNHLKNNLFNIDKIKDFQTVMDNVIVEIVADTEDNRKLVEGKTVNHNLDFIERFMIKTVMPGTDAFGVYAIPEEIFKEWNISKDILREVAINNLDEQAEILPFQHYFAIQNKDRSKAIGQMLNSSILDVIASKYNVDKMTIIPSSYYQVICVPYKEEDMQKIYESVKQINSTLLKHNKVIDNAYIYDVKTHNLDAYNRENCRDWRDDDEHEENGVEYDS